MSLATINSSMRAYTFESDYRLPGALDELTVVNTGGAVARGGSYAMGGANFGAGVVLGNATGYLTTPKSVRNCGPEAGHTGTQYFGFAAWIPAAPANPTDSIRLLGRLGPSLNESSWWLQHTSPTTVQLNYRSATTSANVTTQLTTLSLVDGAPMFVCGAFDSNGAGGVTTRLFVNGVSLTGGGALNMRASTAPLLLGYDGLSLDGAALTLAQFALYNSATDPFSVQDMADLYAGGSFLAGPPFGENQFVRRAASLAPLLIAGGLV